jgi:hypothetical protein
MWLVGCPPRGDAGSGDAASQPAADGAPDHYAVCDTFTKVGDPCGPAGSTICFVECDSGGCQCKPTASGGGVWTCKTDLSCVPESGPLDDTGSLDDAGAPMDATLDG